MFEFSGKTGGRMDHQQKKKKSHTKKPNKKCLSFLGKQAGEWTIGRKMTSQKQQEDQAEKQELGKGDN